MKTEKFFIVRLYYREKMSPFSSKFIFVGNRTLSAGYVHVGSPDVIGILENISGLGQKMGEVLPSDRFGSIVLTDRRGSLDGLRKISDLLEKHIFLEQRITVYSYQRKAGVSVGSSSDLEVEFDGKISDLSVDINNESITFAMKSENISTAEFFTQVTNESFPDTLNENYGKKLPFVIGQGEVSGVLIAKTEGVSPDVQFLLVSEFDATEFSHGNLLDDIFVYDKNEFFPVIMPVTGDTTAFNLFPQVIVDQSTPADEKEYSTRINAKTTSDKYVISRVITLAEKSATDLSNATFVKEIYEEFKETKQFSQSIARATNVSIVEQSAQAGDYADTTYFDRPVYFTEKEFYVSFRISDTVKNPATQWKRFVTDNAVRGSIYLRTQDEAVGSRDWVFQRASDPELRRHLTACRTSQRQLTSSYGFLTLYSRNEISSSIGFDIPRIFRFNGASYGITVLTHGTLTYCVFDNEKFVWNISGLRDITNFVGSGAGAVLTRADRVLKMLLALSLRKEGFTGGLPAHEDLINTTDFSAGAYCGNVSGVWDSGGLRDLVIDILDNSCSRLAPRRAGNWRLWSFGAPIVVKTVITESDCVLQNINIEGNYSIINKIAIRYDYQAERNIYNRARTRSDDDSIFLYGEKTLDQNIVNLNFITENTEAQRWIDYKFSRFAQERMIVKLTLPYWKDDYRNLELLDIILVSHVSMPSHFGSSDAGTTKPLTTDGSDVGVDYNRGDLWRRAKSYPMQIIERNPVFNINDEPELDLTLEVLSWT